jgi:subtilase family serine protease
MMSRLGRVMLSMAAVCVAAMGVQAQNVMTHHVREVVRNGTAAAMGRLPAEQTMSLDLVLPLRDAAGLKSFLADVYNPKSPNYRHFLTPAEFTARFGPTADQYEAVTRFATSHGLTVTGGSRDGMEVQVKGPVSAVETAFHVNMRTYQHPTENRIFYAPDREPVADLPFNLWHISGMDNYSKPHPLYVKKSDYAVAHGMEPEAVVKHATTGSGPSASFLGSDMRAAYYGSGSLTGAGQNLGLFEYEGTDLADLNTYYKNVGQTLAITPQLLSVDGTSTACVDTRAGGNCDDTEQTLDMTQALGMAPGLASLVVYIGSTDTAIISAMTTHSPLPTTIGCSWGWTPADPSTLDPYFQKMAAQGQNFFAASGDSSTWSSRNEAWPADDAYVVSVGGTDLVTASAGGAWKSETAWASSGGGITPDKIAIPAWQQLSGVINSSNKGSTTLRNGPDVSANANYTFYTCSDQTTCLANEYGGTSFAAPMWAGYIALVNQQLASQGEKPIGFINPTIYAQNVTSSYAADFHDITSGTSGSYSAVTGFDLVTGWGSPNSGLLAALAGSTTTQPGFTLSASPASVSIAQGATGSTTITSTATGGFDSAVTLTASGLPTGVTAAFSPASITGSGSSTLTFTVGSTATAGTYSITVTGTSGSTTETTTVSLTVTSSGGTSGFSVTASPTSLSVARSSSGTVTVTTAVTGGFSSAISLSASGLPSGVTATFSPSSITGAGSSTLTLKASSSATTGSKTVTITAKSGSTSHTTTVTLTVTRRAVKF